MPKCRRRARGVGLLAALLFLSLATGPGATAFPWVLVLGLRRPGPAAGPGLPPPSLYRTLALWVAGGAVSSGEREGLLVARQDRLWEIGIRRRESKAWVEDVPWAAPLGTPPRPQAAPEPKRTSGYSAAEITFAGSRWMSLFRTTASYTEGAAHPWERRSLETVSLDEPSVPVGIARVLGVDALVALRSRGERYLAEHAEDRERLEAAPRREAWGLERRRGAWIVRGVLGCRSEVFGAGHAGFDVGLEAPARLVGQDSLPAGWSTVFRYVPRALDAVSSPDGDLVAVLTPGSLLVYDGPGSLRRRQPVGMLDLHADETAVSIQWASGSSAERWRKELR